MTGGGERSLGDTVRHGARWLAGAHYVGLVVRLAVAVALARLLGPADLGVMALAMAVIGIGVLVQESGFGAALVRHRGTLDDAAGAVLVVTLAGGLVLALGVGFGAPFIATWLAQPRLAPVLEVMAAVCVLRAAAQAPRALLQRALRFRALAVLEFAATVAYGAVGLTLAAAGVGMWSLVAAQLASETLLAGATWWLQPVAVPRRLDAGAVRALARFGRPVMIANLLSLLHAQLPTLVVGRLLGATPLGLLTVATRWAQLPVMGVTHLAGRVAYPAFARLGDDVPALAAAWLRVLGAVLALAVPAAAALAVLADPLVRTLYDPRWLGAVAPLQWLAFFGLFHAIAATTGEVMKAMNRPRLVALWALVYDAILIAALWWLVPRFGLVGAAMASAIAPGLVMVGTIATVARVLGVTLRALATRVVPPLAGAAALAVTAAAGRAATDVAGGPAPVALLVGALAGVVAYATVLAMASPGTVDELRRLAGLDARHPLPERWRRRARSTALALAGVTAVLLAGEASLRVAARGTSAAALGPWQDRRAWERIRTLDHHAPMPRAGGHTAWRLQPWNEPVEYRLDGDGLRIAGAVGAGSTTRCRLVVLGDSTAFGYGVPAGAALGAALERRLATSGIDAAVHNAGVCGANVDHLARWAATTVARLRPDVVLLVVSPWSLRTDAPPAATTTRDRVGEALVRHARPLLRWSALAERAGWHGSHLMARLAGWPSTSVIAWELAPLVEPAAAFRARWASVTPALDRLVDAAAATGAVPVVIYVPLDVQVSRARNALYRDARLPYASYGFDDRDYRAGGRYRHALHAWAATRVVPWVDTTPTLRRHAGTAFLDDDYHLSAAGHDVLAAALRPVAGAACASAPTVPPSADVVAPPVHATAAAAALP